MNLMENSWDVRNSTVDGYVYAAVVMTSHNCEDEPFRAKFFRRNIKMYQPFI